SETNGRIVDLSLECGVFALLQVGHRVDRLADRIYELNLATLLFDGRHFERPTEAIGQRDRRLHAPRIAEVDVVERNGALVLRGSQRRIKSEVRAGAGEGGLGDRDDAKNRGVVATERACGTASDSAGENAGHIDARTAAGAELVDRLVVDPATVISALVEV